MRQDSWARTLHLAFQCIGVIYGDIGTSPLYVYASTFTSGISNVDDLYGVLSLIFYSIILLPMIKYVFIVLYANDNGDGKFSLSKNPLDSSSLEKLLSLTFSLFNSLSLIIWWDGNQLYVKKHYISSSDVSRQGKKWFCTFLYMNMSIIYS